MSKNEFIILTEDKHPTHKFKNGIGLKSWEEVKDFDNIAQIVPDPFVVLDFDTEDDAKIMLDIVEHLDLHCNVMITDRGFHFWFRCSEQLKNFTKNRLAIGIYCDRKVCNRNAYVVIKRRGQLREWLRQYPDDDVDFLPKWLTPVTTASAGFKGLKSGDGRNQILYNYILTLQNAGFQRDEVIRTLEIINDFVFDERLSDYELQQICREEAFKSEEEIEQQKEERRSGGKSEKFDHTVFVEQLEADNKLITLHDVLYKYENGYYKIVDKEIEKQLIALCPMIKQSQRNEVISYLKIDTAISSDDVVVDPYVVNLMNGRYDLKSGMLKDYDSNCYEFSRIPVVYNPRAKCDAVDRMLGNIFLHDEDVLNLFYEILGYCIIRSLTWQKAFLFYGSGANGKSVLFEMMIDFLGDDNVSKIPLDHLSRQFSTAELEFKYANISDDISFTRMKDTGTLKKLITGDPIQVERKYSNPFSFRSYATQIFACNEIPHSPDKSDGMMRRLCLIPCLAKFTDSDPDYDPNILDKVTTEEARSHLFNLAIIGFKRLQQNQKFTEPKIVVQAKKKYVIENSSVLTWVEDVGLTADQLIEKPSSDSYLAFSDWCKLNGVKDIVGKKNFNKEIIRHFDFSEDLILRRRDGRVSRFFQINLD